MNIKLKTIVIVLFGINTALANPQDGTVISGNVSIQQENANKLGITQTTDKAIIDWRQFNIAPNEHTQFYMPSASSVSLNRVVGQDPSSILGKLTANGQIFLVNPNGILFGAGAQIDVAGLVATTHNIRNEDFLAGNYNFNIAGNPNASVINQGDIRIADTGIAAFVAPSVVNNGVIVAKLGKVQLAAANGFSLDFHGDNLLNFMVDDKIAQTAYDQNGKPLNSFVENSGRIEANGGYVLLTAKGAEQAIHGVINQSGIIEANTVGTQQGKIILHANQGDLKVSGTLNATAPNGGDGGFIETSGSHVSIDPNAKISTAASSGKTGQWLLDPTDYKIAATGGNSTGADIANYLALNNLEIKTSSADTGTGNGDIFVNDNITWNNSNKLTLTAYRDINISAPINAANGGSIKLRADSEGNSVGTVNFTNAGYITANTGTVDIYYNPVSYTDTATQSNHTGMIKTYKSDGISVATISNPGNPYKNFILAESTAYMLVNDVNQLQNIKTNPNGNYALGKNIDASATSSWNNGSGFSTILPVSGTYDFTGTLDGQGHTINNLTGLLFGRVGEYGILKNIGLTNVNIINNDYDVGGLVGMNAGTISNSYVTGNISGGTEVGGLVGWNALYGNINQCYTNTSVRGNSAVGGLVGINYGNVSNSYTTDNTTGNSATGGLVGYLGSGLITNSYTIGKATAPRKVGGIVGYLYGGSIVKSYYNADVQTFGDTVISGTDKTTAEMQQQATFTNWDFNNTWQINEGVSYPTFKTASTSSTQTITPATNPIKTSTPSAPSTPTTPPTTTTTPSTNTTTPSTNTPTTTANNSTTTSKPTTNTTSTVPSTSTSTTTANNANNTDSIHLPNNTLPKNTAITTIIDPVGNFLNNITPTTGQERRNNDYIAQLPNDNSEIAFSGEGTTDHGAGLSIEGGKIEGNSKEIVDFFTDTGKKMLINEVSKKATALFLGLELKNIRALRSFLGETSVESFDVIRQIVDEVTTEAFNSTISGKLKGAAQDAIVDYVIGQLTDRLVKEQLFGLKTGDDREDWLKDGVGGYVIDMVVAAVKNGVISAYKHGGITPAAKIEFQISLTTDLTSMAFEQVLEDIELSGQIADERTNVYSSIFHLAQTAQKSLDKANLIKELLDDARKSGENLSPAVLQRAEKQMNILTKNGTKGVVEAATTYSEASGGIGGLMYDGTFKLTKAEASWAVERALEIKKELDNGATLDTLSVDLNASIQASRKTNQFFALQNLVGTYVSSDIMMNSNLF